LKAIKGGRVHASTYASVKDARLRIALKAHDLLVGLISAGSEYQAQLVLNELYDVMNELDEYYDLKEESSDGKAV